jgi:hypothetical protein
MLTKQVAPLAHKFNSTSFENLIELIEYLSKALDTQYKTIS